ncbi:MAG: sugar ABC transporter permease [Dehalococcoidia bacterium]
MTQQEADSDRLPGREPVAEAQSEGVGPNPSAVARRDHRRSELARLAPWVAPAVTILAVVFGYSFYRLVGESLHFRDEWVGLSNFSSVLSNPVFRTAVWHNALLLAMVPLIVVISYVLAALVHSRVAGWQTFRSTLLLPYILPIPVVAVVFGQILQLNGALNAVLDGLGLGFLAQDWLGDPGLALWSLAGVIVWREVGLGATLILASLVSVPETQFEAAALDGAGPVKTHIRVIAPQVRGVVVFFGVLEAITMVSYVFNYVYVISNGRGGPGTSTMVTELFIYQNAFQYRAPGFAAAAAVLLLLGTSVLIASFYKIERRMLSGHEAVK